MPVPSTLADDVLKAELAASDDLDMRIEETAPISLDPSLEGATALTILPNQSSAAVNNNSSSTKFIAGHGNGAICVYSAHPVSSTNRLSNLVQTLKIGSSTGLPIMKVLSHPKEPDLIFAASVDSNIYQCHMKKPTAANVFYKEVGNEPMAMCFCDDSQHLITAGKDTHLRMYDPLTNQVVRAYHGAKLDLTGSSSLVGSDSGHSSPQNCRPSRKVFSLRQSPSDTHCFYSAGWDNSIKVWDSRTSEGMIRNVCHKNSPHVCGDALDVKVCGGIGLETVVTGSWVNKKSLQLWDPSGHQKQPLMRNVRFPSTRQDGEYLYACRFLNDSVVVAGGSGSKDAVFINYHTSQPLLAVGSGTHPVTSIDCDVTTGLTVIGGTNYDVIHVTQLL